MSTPAFNHLGGSGTTPQQQQQQQQQFSPENLVVVKMGVDELRALITDVVKKAVEGLRAAEHEKSKTTSAVDVDPVDAGAAVPSGKGVEFHQQEEEVDDDEIVVAGSFTAAAAAGNLHDHGFSPMKEE
jgi:hypothetical protein